MNTAEIAIIGMATRFPGSRNQREFHHNLQTGRDCVTEASPQRFCDSTFPLGDERYQVMGLLEQIDRFDRRFFNISPREAEQMDPHQRLTMEVAYESIEDSGYSPGSWNGKQHAMIMANANYTYSEHLPDPDPSMYSGMSTFTIAGRLARFLNTTGPTFVVDTGCSSGLVCIGLACDELALGRAEVALVAGAVLVFDPLPVEIDVDVGITSHDGKTRSFNAGSNGSGVAEAVVSFVLKPLAQAKQDGDNVYAVIKSSAINSSSQSSASLTATSSAAQSDLLQLAWKRAGIDPLSVGYIEAHGSGTQLGDPIEIHGIDTAFRNFTDKRHFCAVSSIKSNIGHTDKCAGLSGLAKAALSLRHRELYPSLHFVTPNPLIDFENSSTYINTKCKSWERSGDAPLRAGVNSFGFSGNNAHVVLEEYPDNEAPAPENNDRAAPDRHLVTFSSKRADGVAANLTALAEHLDAVPGIRLADVSFTRNNGREHFRHRAALIAKDLPDLLEQLRGAAETAPNAVADNVAPILLCSPDIAPPAAWTEQLTATYSTFNDAWQNCGQAWTGEADAPAFQRFAFQFSLGRLLAELGVRTANITGIGTGALVVDALLEESSLEEALQALRDAPVEEPPADLADRLQALVDDQTAANPVLFIELGPAGCLARELQELKRQDNAAAFEVLAADLEATDSLLSLLREVYLQGGPIDWDAFHAQVGGRRISLPGYQFERLRSWYAPPHSREDYDAWHRRVYDEAAVGLVAKNTHKTLPADAAAEEPATIIELDENWTSTEQAIARIWIETLKIDRVELDDDFFALGGHSLFGSMVRNRIEQSFGLTLEFRDIFAQNTIRMLAGYVDKRVAEGGADVTPAAVSIPRLPSADHYAVAPAQFRLWVLDQKEGAMNKAYNVSIPLRLHGALDTDRLEKALQKLVARHESLRTHFIEVDGRPRQVVNETVDLEITHHTCKSDSRTATIDGLIKPFDLSRPPLIRASIIRDEDDASHTLLIDIHHTLMDGASYSVLLNDLGAFYANRELPPVTVTYKDYAAWRMTELNSGLMREAGEYWRQLFEATPPPVEMPTDFPRPAVRSFDGDVREARIEPEQMSGLYSLARQENASVFMVLLAGYSALLAKYSGHDDIVVGSSVAGRGHAELEPIVGMFVNTVAFRTRPREDFSFRDFLAAVREHCFQVYKYQDYPFETLLEQLELAPDRSRNPLFDSMLVLQNFNIDPTPLEGDVTISAGEFGRHAAKFDLTIEGYEYEDGLNFTLEYCAALFRPETVDRIANDLISLLGKVAADPDVRLGELSLEDAPDALATADDDFTFATT